MTKEELQEQKNRLQTERLELEGKLKDMDYIGVKIATGRASRAEYAEKIALMAVCAERINAIDAEIENIDAQLPAEEPSSEVATA